jgi:hypothetical protein
LEPLVLERLALVPQALPPLPQALQEVQSF